MIVERRRNTALAKSHSSSRHLIALVVASCLIWSVCMAYIISSHRQKAREAERAQTQYKALLDENRELEYKIIWQKRNLKWGR